ncbi:hypothetical protein H2200_012342 [Cladophialophora chaetospira]|uniref:Zn(2)-C6 fungal-type domain-containing protein n=1 Tax=Cladophialophora chaetospira TaxID=386627 RepID=A0AA38WXS1_9EURO|nr:hypothetical protein H2200_012342 [Cladophialophora chaetospira]
MTDSAPSEPRKDKQRADVKALHIKKCQGEPAEESIGLNGASSSPRKRVRLACNRCRQKKIACNGQEPCAQCRNAPGDCEYAGSRDTRESTLDEAELDVEATSFRGEQDHGVPSISLASGASNEEPITNNHFALGQDTHQIGFLPDTETTAPIMMPDAVLHDGLDLSLTSGDLLDPMTMNDIWQMPPFDSQFWLDGSDLSWSEGPFDATFLMPDYSASSVSQQRITGMMQEYFDRKSRKSSPSAPDKAGAMWYSAPPNLDDHDNDVLNVFINLFHKHVSETFTLFKEIRVPRRTRPEFILAMAATGGLFCSVPGSADVAKSMYNDSRRLLLASHHRSTGTSGGRSNRKDNLFAACTFILLQLYGLCSGDKRSYEFVEAFYGDLILAVKDYSRSCLESFELEKENENLLVIVMYRPPCFPWRHVNSFAQSPHPEHRIGVLLQYPAALTKDRRVEINSTHDKDQLLILASLSAYLWPGTSLSESTGFPDKPNHEASRNPSLWKSDFAEMACDTWLRSQEKPRVSTLVVYYHLNIMLHANLVLLQRFAHSSPTSTARDPQKSSIAKAIQSWMCSRDYEVAHWHAEQLISSTESAIAASKNNAGQPSSYTSPETVRSTFEALHTPYLVYYAVLVLWCGALSADLAYSSVASAKAHLVRGEMILSAHKARIAQLLAKVLIEIK